MILHLDRATDTILHLEGPTFDDGLETLDRYELKILAAVALSNVEMHHGYDFVAGMMNRRHDRMRAKAAKEAAK